MQHANEKKKRMRKTSRGEAKKVKFLDQTLEDIKQTKHTVPAPLAAGHGVVKRKRYGPLDRCVCSGSPLIVVSFRAATNPINHTHTHKTQLSVGRRI